MEKKDFEDCGDESTVPIEDERSKFIKKVERLTEEAGYGYKFVEELRPVPSFVHKEEGVFVNTSWASAHALFRELGDEAAVEHYAHIARQSQEWAKEGDPSDIPREGPTKSQEANEFLATLEVEKERLLSLIPPAKTNICGGCKKEMEAVKGMWWCASCKVWKVQNAREMLRNIHTPYIPLYVSQVDVTVTEKEKSEDE